MRPKPVYKNDIRLINYLIKLYYQLRGYSSFWRDRESGRWYAYDPEHLKGYWSYEAERVPIPVWRDYLWRLKKWMKRTLK